MDASATAIETETCGRCAGSGRYSFNQIHGSRCYGCGGTGKVFTKRGAAAHRFLEELRSKRASEFQVGELVRYDQVTPYATARIWSTVTAVERTTLKSVVNGEAREVPMVTLSLTNKGTVTLYTVGLDTMLRQGFDAPTKQAQLAQALAYQATLTKAGKPLARAA